MHQAYSTEITTLLQCQSLESNDVHITRHYETTSKPANFMLGLPTSQPTSITECWWYGKAYFLKNETMPYY